jgi:hypothetical protein
MGHMVGCANKMEKKIRKDSPCSAFQRVPCVDLHMNSRFGLKLLTCMLLSPLCYLNMDVRSALVSKHTGDGH